MTQEYAFRNMILGEVENVCNEMAANDFGPDEMYKEGNRMYILFSKWLSTDDVELSELDQAYIALDALSTRLSMVESALTLLGGGVANENTPMEFSEPEGDDSPE